MRQWTPAFTQYPDLTQASIADLVKLSRTDPILSDYLWLPNSPPLFPNQKIVIRGMHDHFLTFFQAIRGAAKSYDVARAVLNFGLNHQIKVGFTAPTYRQALMTFNYVDDLIEENSDAALPLSLARERDGITVRGSMEASIYIKNGTVYKALPMGNGERLRGERFDILHVDEFFLMERTMFRSHLLPFLLGHSDKQFGKKLILTTSAEYEDSYAYHFLTHNVLPKMIEEDAKAADDSHYRRSYFVMDVNVDDLRTEGYEVNPEVIAMLTEGTTSEEKQQALFNRWVGTSGQFFPGNILERAVTPGLWIEYEADGSHQYAFSVDVATQRDGDFFVIDVWKYFEESRKMGLVNSVWRKGLSADEMAYEVLELDKLFDPQWIIMDKGGGGLFVRDSLKKRQLEFKDGTIHKVTNPILEHNENMNLSGVRKLVFNRATDPLVRQALAGWRSRGGEYISTEDVLVHQLHEGLRQVFLQDDMPYLVPAEYRELGGSFESESAILDRIRTGFSQLRHLALAIKELPDGQKEVIRSKVAKVPMYVWKSGNKDGASAIIYSFIAYALHFRDDGRDADITMPIFAAAPYEQINEYQGLVDHSPGQLWAA